MDAAAELESGAEDKGGPPAPSVTVAPVQLSLWPPPRSTRHSSRRRRQLTVFAAVVLVLAVFYIGLTLLADILNALLDPRLRTG